MSMKLDKLTELAQQYDIKQTADTLTLLRDGEIVFLGQSGIPMNQQIDSAYDTLIGDESTVNIDPISPVGVADLGSTTDPTDPTDPTDDPTDETSGFEDGKGEAVEPDAFE